MSHSQFRRITNHTETCMPRTRGRRRKEGAELPEPSLRWFRHRLNGYLAQRVPSICPATSSRLFLMCEVFGGIVNV